MNKLAVHFYIEGEEIIRKIRCKDGTEIPMNDLMLDVIEDTAYINMLLSVDSVLINHKNYKIVQRQFSIDSPTLNIIVE